MKLDAEIPDSDSPSQDALAAEQAMPRQGLEQAEKTADAADPSDPTVQLQWLDPRYVTHQRAVSAVVFGILGIAASIGALVACLALGSWLARSGVLIGLCAFLALLVFFGFFWPKIVYRNVRWCFTDVGFEYWRGVLWKHRLAVPASRVQHVDVAQGPVERMFGLGKLTIYTAGTKHSSIEVEGFSHEQALRLRDQLIAQKEAIDVL